MKPRVSIIILNWNGWQDTIECLESLYQINYPNFDVIVIDNNSTDKSIEKIKEYCEVKGIISDFLEYKLNKTIKTAKYTKKELVIKKKISDIAQEKIILIKNDKNYGFAEGNNIGIKFSLDNLKPDYILLLNNDTTVDKHFLGELLNVAESNPSYGIIGPKIYFYSEPNKIQVTWNKISFWTSRIFLAGAGKIDKGQYEEIKETGHVPGSCFLIKRKLIDTIGILNNDYYCYWEETDYCIRAKDAGYKSIYCPSARIWHKVSQSSRKISGFSIYYISRNRFYFMKSHTSKMQYMIFLIYFFGFHLWFSIASLMVNQNTGILPYFLSGTYDGWNFSIKKKK